MENTAEQNMTVEGSSHERIKQSSINEETVSGIRAGKMGQPDRPSPSPPEETEGLDTLIWAHFKSGPFWPGLIKPESEPG